MNFKKIIQKEHVLSIAVSLFMFACVPAVLAWTPPTAVAPNENTPPPINIGGAYQIRSGKLGLFGGDVALRVSRDGSYTPDNVSLLPTLLVGVNGRMGAAQYCDEEGKNCKTILELKALLGL